MSFARQKIFRKGILACTLSAIVAGTLLFPAFAYANSGVSQGFPTTASNLVPGTLMGLQSGSQQLVEPAVSTKAYRLLGVVADQPLVALSDGEQQVQITVSGPARILVSTINGAIKEGDKITASPISGIGMRATDAGQIVGTAQSDLDVNKATRQTITDKFGKEQTVEVGTVPLEISVGYYSGIQDQGKLASVLPPFLLSFANNVAGQQVSPLRVFIGIFVLIIGFAIVANMLQSGIRANIISVGRNPLAKRALHRELLDVSMTALGVLILTLIITYVLVKL